jgi:hypothetical protein
MKTMQTKNENPLLTQLLAGGILIMLATLIGSRQSLPAASGGDIAGFGSTSRSRSK